jgi:hypothetical protein
MAQFRPYLPLWYVRTLFRFPSGVPKKKIAIGAVFHGQMEVLEYLHDWDAEWLRGVGEDACHMAAAAGRLPVLAWLNERGCALTAAAWSAAAARGDTAMLHWLKARGCPSAG